MRLLDILGKELGHPQIDIFYARVLESLSYH